MEETCLTPQSRHSAKLFLQSSELGLPQPLTRRRVCPPPCGSGGRNTLAGKRGDGRIPIPTRGHTLWYSIYIYFVTTPDSAQADLLEVIDAGVGLEFLPAGGGVSAQAVALTPAVLVV
jgi:hypothetical protein